jgi:hypothetical protein
VGPALDLEKELEIGARIQTCILPAAIEVPGLSVSARMIPASEVGGDYYGVFPTHDGAWIGIGVVAGHGLTSGLVMLMMQSAVAALGRARPDALPRPCPRCRVTHPVPVRWLAKPVSLNFQKLESAVRTGRRAILHVQPRGARGRARPQIAQECFAPRNYVVANTHTW